jgi:16S rRNA (adenine1518-N6/adenine1519-N6)-dimethyltransferase
MSSREASGYLGAAQIRERAADLGLRPTKQWGQNFVVDANTVKRIVRLAGVGPQDSVVEVGPGLGSLTLALLPEAGHVTVVEVDPTLAAALPDTVRRLAPAHADRLTLVHADAMRVRTLPDPQPTALVANLPYNVSVPVVLGFLESFPTIERVLVMVQLEVAERLAAAPGSKTYGVPSVKAAWYAAVRLAGHVPRNVFWPVPNVESGLVLMERRDPPPGADRADTFACIDAAFAQRRKTLRAALAGWAGSPARAEEYLVAAGIDPRQRGEQLRVEQFAAIAAARARLAGSSTA